MNYEATLADQWRTGSVNNFSMKRRADILFFIGDGLGAIQKYVTQKRQTFDDLPNLFTIDLQGDQSYYCLPLIF